MPTIKECQPQYHPWSSQWSNIHFDIQLDVDLQAALNISRLVGSIFVFLPAFLLSACVSFWFATSLVSSRQEMRRMCCCSCHYLGWRISSQSLPWVSNFKDWPSRIVCAIQEKGYEIVYPNQDTMKRERRNAHRHLRDRIMNNNSKRRADAEIERCKLVSLQFSLYFRRKSCCSWQGFSPTCQVRTVKRDRQGYLMLRVLRMPD